MKKKILLFLLLFIPFMINAEEKCNIISGNGQDIGSEIECAGEHFYIIEDKEDTVRMLAKYNLDVGSVFNKVTVSAERYNEIKELCSGSSYCDLMFEEPEFVGYKYIYGNYDNEDGTHTYMIYYDLESEEIKQSPNAIGAHGDEKGNPEFPEYGVIQLYSVNASIDNYYDETNFADINVTEYNFEYYYRDKEKYYLEYYEDFFNTKGYIVNTMDLLSVNDVNKMVYKENKRYLPLGEWQNPDNWISINTEYNNKPVYIVGSIKEYLSEEYSWLFNTTYWTKTILNDENYDESAFFIDTLGNLCNANACFISVGAGIRPVVEINKDYINYNLTTKSEEGGTLETDKSHVVGDTIVLNATAKTGYKLEKLIVTTESGTTIEVSGEDIVENDDGTISINPEIFTMPLENVVFEAKWQIINPKTGVSSSIGLIFTMLLVSLSAFYCIRSYNKSYEL